VTVKHQDQAIIVQNTVKRGDNVLEAEVVAQVAIEKLEGGTRHIIAINQTNTKSVSETGRMIAIGTDHTVERGQEKRNAPGMINIDITNLVRGEEIDHHQERIHLPQEGGHPRTQGVLLNQILKMCSKARMRLKLKIKKLLQPC